MTKQEFEKLYRAEVTEDAFELINMMYMLDENETKENFVARFKNMSKLDVLDECQKVIRNIKDYYTHLIETNNKEFRERDKELSGTIDGLNHMLADEKQKHHDFVSTIVMLAHGFENNEICKTCADDLGVKDYFKVMVHNDCTPSTNDIKIMYDYLNKDITK